METDSNEKLQDRYSADYKRYRASAEQQKYRVSKGHANGVAGLIELHEDNAEASRVLSNCPTIGGLPAVIEHARKNAALYAKSDKPTIAKNLTGEADRLEKRL